MAQSLGTLFLELKLDASSYNQSLDVARSQAAAIGKEIEGKLNLKPLEPKVVHTQLKELNDHLSLKQKHWAEVQRDFDSKPLTPKVDASQIQQATNAVREFKREIQSIRQQSATGVKLQIGIDDRGVDTNKLADAIAAKTADALSKALSQSLGKSLTGSTLSSIGAVLSNTIGAVARGALEGVGADLAKGLSTGIGSALQNALGGTLGSSELVGEKLVEGLITSVRGKLRDVPEKLKKDLKKAFVDSANEALGESEISRASLVRQSESRTKNDRESRKAQEQANLNRREALRGNIDAASALADNQSAMANIEAMMSRGNQLAGKLEAQRFLAQLDGNQKLVNQINDSLAENAKILADLAGEEAALLEAQSKLHRNAENARKKVEAAKKVVSDLQPEAMPAAYLDAIDRATGGKMPAQNMIPKLVVNDAKLRATGTNAQYGIQSNTIQITSELKKAIDEGNLSAKQLYTLYEEINHAIDYGFGSLKGTQAARSGKILRPMVDYTDEEFSKVAKELQAYDPKERESELNAKVRARRNVADVAEKQVRQQNLDRIEGVFGVGGGKYSDMVTSKLANFRFDANLFQKIASSKNMGVGEGVDAFIDAVDKLESGSKEIIKKLQASRRLSSDELKSLQKAINDQFDDISRLTGQFPVIKEQFLKHVDETEKLRKQAAQQEKIQQVAETAGGIARGAVNIAGTIAQGAGNIAKTAMSSAPMQALGSSARMGYSMLQGAESLALDVLPFGRTLKGVGQQVVLPAMMFGAAQHMLPGGGAIAQGMSTVAHGALAPFAHGASNVLSGGMADIVANAIPNKFGLGGLESQIISTLSGSINGLVSGVSGAIADVGTMVLGGKLIQNAALKPVKAILPASTQAQTPLQLPFSPKQASMAALPSAEITGGLAKATAALQPAQIEKMKSAANTVAYETGKVARTAVDNVTQIAEQIKVLSPEQALARSQDISKKFRDAFARLKEVQKQGNEELASHIADSIRTMADAAKQEIASITASLGDQAKMGTKLGSQLAQTKGQITQAENKTKRYENLRSAAVPDPWGEDEDVRKQLNLERLKGNNPVNQLLKGAENASDRFDSAFKSINKAFDDTFKKSSEAVNSAAEAIMNGTAAAQQAQPPMGGLAKKLDAVVGAFLGFQALLFVGPVLLDLAAQARQTALEFERFERIINFTQGGANKGAAAIAQISEQAKSLNVDLRQAIQGYAQFSASTKETPLEGRATNQIFGAVTQASGVMGLDAQSQERVFLALSQMASKSVISMEELRQQLGESLPSAMNIAARSMNMTTQEFNALVSSGQLLATDFLPKFASQLKAETSVGLEASAKSSQASITRLNNAIYELQVTAGKGLLPVQSMGSDVIAAGLNLITQNVGTLLKAFTALGLYLSVTLLQQFGLIPNSLGAIAQAVKTAVANFNLSSLSAGFVNVGRSVATAMTPMMNFAGKLALITAGIMALTEAYDLLRDRGGSARESADRMRDSLEALQKTLGNQQKPQEQEGIFGFKTGNKYADRALTESAKQPWWMQLSGLSAINSAKAGYDAFKADKTTADTQKALGDLLNRGGGIQSQVSGLMGRSSDISALQQVEKAINDNQLKMRATRSLNPNDAAGLRQLQEEYDKLLKQREQLSKPFDEAKAAISSYIATLKSQISEYSDNPQYAEQVKRLKVELERAEQAQSDLNRAVESNLSVLQKFERAWQRISDRADDAVQSIKDAGNANNAAVGNALAAGDITPGQANSMKQVNARSQLSAEIATRQQQLEALKAEFEKISGSQYLAAYGMSLNSGAKELATRGEKLTAPQEKAAFTSAARIKEIESEIKGLDASLADSASTISESLREASKAVTDFTRGIARQIEDINASVKQQALEIKSSNLKAKIDEALTGVQSTFVDGLVGAIVDFANAGKEKAQNLINAINAGRNTMRQVEDAQLNAGEMMRNQPGYGNIGGMTTGGATTRFSGIQVTSAVDASGEPGLDYVVANGQRGAKFGSLTDGQVIKTVTNQNWESNLEAGGTRRGYGNQVIVRTIDRVTGEIVDLLYAHLDNVLVKEGEKVGIGSVLGTQGRTGSTTGAHVSVDFFAKDANYAGKAQLAMRDRMARELAGGAQNLNRAIASNNIAPTGRGTGGINLSTFFQGGSNSLAAKVIGMAEGNRTASGGFTAHAQGHTDPGNGAFNIGSFSAQGSLNRGSIAASDEAVINELLKPYADRLAQQASRVGVQVTPKLLLNYLDTLNQGGAQVVTGWNDSTKGAGFLGKLGMIKGRENDDAAIRQLRVESYRNTSGRLETTFASEADLARDQQRRMGELNKAGNAFGLFGGNAGMIKPTTGMTVGDINAAQQASQLNIESAQQVNAELAKFKTAASALQKSEMDVALARNNEIDKSTQRNAIAMMKTAQRSAEDEAKAARDRLDSVRDQGRSVGYDTPEKEYESRTTEIRRRFRDLGVELNRAVEQNQDSLKALNEAEKQALERMKAGEMPDEIGKQILSGIKKMRDSANSALKDNQQALSELKAVEEKQIKDAEQKRDLKIAQREQEFRGRFVAQQTEQMKLEAEMIKSFDPSRAIALQDEAQRAEIKNSTTEQILNLQETARQSGMAEEKVQELIAGFRKLEDLKLENVTQQTKKLRQELEFAQKEQIFDSINKLGSAEIEGFRIVGMDRFARDIEKEQALAQERMSYAQDMRQINDMGLDSETKSQVLANRDRAHAKKIDNIKRQYSVLNEIIANNKGAFQDFFTGLLNGTESFGSAFSKMVQSIANNLASMASDFLTNELMGIFTGKNRGAAQKDAKDLFGGVSPAVTYDKQGRELSIAAESAGNQFVGLTQQAGQTIISAAEAFNQIVSTGGFSSIDGGNLPIRMMDFTGETAQLPEFVTAIDTSSAKLFDSAQNASFSILDGVQIASEYLADAGTGTSDNLLSGLSKGLPGILQSVLGGISGKGGGGGIGGILGSLVSPILGGLFGGGGGDIMGGLAIDLGSPVVPMFKNGGYVRNFARGGFSSDNRPAIDGDLLKKGNNPLAQAIRREGSGAMVGVFNDREYVLSAPETQLYFALGFDKIIKKGRIPNFVSGGLVGTGAASKFTAGRQVSITVPVSVNEGSSVDPVKLSESIRGAVQNEIAKQQRPGGQLY